MPLIANRDKREKVPFNVEIVEDIHKQILTYCEWAGVTDLGYFVEEAAKYIFSRDPSWTKQVKETQKDIS